MICCIMLLFAAADLLMLLLCWLGSGVACAAHLQAWKQHTDMASAGSGMPGSQSSVGGSINNSIGVDTEETGAGIVNQKYPLRAHSTT